MSRPRKARVTGREEWSKGTTLGDLAELVEDAGGGSSSRVPSPVTGGLAAEDGAECHEPLYCDNGP